MRCKRADSVVLRSPACRGGSHMISNLRPGRVERPVSNSNNTITCDGANNSAGDPACTSAKAYLRPAVAHNGRILQLGAKFIF